MAMVWVALFVSSFLCIRSQYIYVNEKDDCASNREAMEEIRGLLIQQGRIQESVDSLRQRMTRLEEDVQFIKRDLKRNLDCQDLYINGEIQSGVYTIYPFGNKRQGNVFCDMESQGGGWTAIQRRLSGSVAFSRAWAEYKKGFGNPAGSYWIGNDVIHHLTKGRNSSLYVSITLTNGTKLYELYNQFSVADETNKYRLFLEGPATGTLGDRMLDTGESTTNLSGMDFSTLDRDNDRASIGGCAVTAGGGGGWWYNACHSAYLNGPWSSANWGNPWYPPLQYGSDITETLMMIKHH